MLTRDAHLRIIEQSPILESIVGNNKEQWVTLKGASEYTSLSIAKLRRAVACGELRVSKRGGRLLFKVYWLDLWLTS